MENPGGYSGDCPGPIAQTVLAIQYVVGFRRTDRPISFSCSAAPNCFQLLIGVLCEWSIDPGYHSLTLFIWKDFDKFRAGPRTTHTVSATGPWVRSD